MKTSWILPDRKQTGIVLLEQGKVTKPLHEALDLRLLPRAFTLGIPEELFLANRTRSLFFLQFARLSNDTNLFAASFEAGTDMGGRAVVLTLLISLCEQERLQPESIADIQLPIMEGDYAKNLLSELIKQFNERTSSLNSLLTAVEQYPEYQTFASEQLRRSANRPTWMKKKSYGND